MKMKQCKIKRDEGVEVCGEKKVGGGSPVVVKAPSEVQILKMKAVFQLAVAVDKLAQSLCTPGVSVEINGAAVENCGVGISVEGDL